MSEHWAPVTTVARAVYDCGFNYVPGLDIIKARMNPWQRETGYCWAYDMAAAHMSMIIDCEPFYFVHGDRLWLIELWKGQYGLETGAEIGLYVDNLSPAIRDDHNLLFLPVPGRNRFFSAPKDSERLIMHFRLYRDGELLIERGPEPHWWLNGWRWGVFTDNTFRLRMDVQITGFPSGLMRDSFLAAVALKQYFPLPLGKTGIQFKFHIPRTPQPASRALAPVAQQNNKHLVDAYNAYKRWKGFTDNDPNNITALDEPATMIQTAALAMAARIRSVPAGARVLDAASAAAAKVNAAMPHDVVTAYHDIHNFFQKNRRKWHHTSRLGD